jgi:hypothetical protein
MSPVYVQVIYLTSILCYPSICAKVFAVVRSILVFPLKCFASSLYHPIILDLITLKIFGEEQKL